MAALLDISQLDGLRSMSSLSPDERQNLVIERNRSIQTICIRIKALLDKLERTEALLRDYEMDLAKLRQAEFLLTKKNEQLDSIEVDILYFYIK